VVILLLACATPQPAGHTATPATEDTGTTVEVAEMDPTRLLVRTSLDLRGVRPSAEEVAAVVADPTVLDSYTETWLADPAFERRVMEIFAVPFRTRLDDFPGSADVFGASDEARFQAAIGEEPLRLVARVAASDRPWTDIVTADWTMSDEVLAEVWPVDYPADTTGWREVHYTDGRPTAGVLATNGLWWRYGSTIENYNRGRANAIARVLLCSDFLQRPVSFSRTSISLESDSLLTQTQTDPNCTTCHVAVDPLGSYLFGFTYYDTAFVSPVYNFAAERDWASGTGIAPSYFGTPGSGLHDLGRQVADDPRFVSCAVETVWEGLLGRSTTLDDFDALTRHRDAFIAGGLHLRDVFRGVVSDPAYRAADTSVTGGVPWKLVPVELLASEVEGLTGFRWTWDGYDMLGTDIYGVRLLAGGADGRYVTTPASEANTTLLLVQSRLAALAAGYAVEHDATRADPLFDLVDPATEPTGDAVAEQVRSLSRRILTTEPGDDDVDDAVALWNLVHDETGSPRQAWAVTLTLLLRDPALLVY
jgi:hypothetical protein